MSFFKIKNFYLGLLLLSLGLFSCRTAPITPPNSLPDDLNRAENQVVWRVNLGSDSDIPEITPRVVGDFLYAASSNGKVAKINYQGEIVWQINIDEPISAGVGADSALVAIGTDSGKIIGINADNGNIVWENSATHELIGPPLVTKQTVVSRSADGLFFGWDKLTGYQNWLIARAVDRLSVNSHQEMISINDAVIATTAKATIFAFFPQNGKIIWERQIAGPFGTTEVERLTNITSRAVTNGLFVCASAFQRNSGCLNLSDGRLIWQGGEGSSAGVAIADNKFIEINMGDELIGMNLADGQPLWRNISLFNRYLTSATNFNSQIIFADGLGIVFWLDPNTGQLIKYLATDGSYTAENVKLNPQLIKTPPVIFKDLIIIQNQNGSILAIK